MAPKPDFAEGNATLSQGSSDLTAPMRALLGFVAAVLAVLTFHQGMWALLYAFGLMPRAPYPMSPVPPLGIPQIASLCFWGGLYGLVFALVMPVRCTECLWSFGTILCRLARVRTGLCP